MLESSSVAQSPSVKRDDADGRARKRMKLSKRETGMGGDSKRNAGLKAESGPISSSPSGESKGAKYGGYNTPDRKAENLNAAHVLPVSTKMHEISMPELSYSILMSVLTFIYEDKLVIKNVDEAVELWCTAERYQFLRLQEQVEKYLEENLTVEKAIGICHTLRELPLLGSLKELLISYLANEIDSAMVRKDFVSIPKDILHNIFCQTQNQKQIDTAFGQQ
mmetsp:Transcript_5948/g.14411  ORF Transcript_5948/g.14411 Transcript_5948/m.14411 type:complete len:221 (-) Transcript_5948:274-936(-)